MLKHIPNKALYVSEPNPMWFGNGPNEKGDPNWSNANWLKSRFHFSFAEYRNSKNSNFGVLRVMNDDLVQPKRGFGEHPHRDMEIMTYVVQGKLTHQDSMGNIKHVGRGGVQYMSAGQGVRHSEFNHGEEPLRFIQCWVVPDAYGYKPRYGQFDGDTAERRNKLQHLVSCLDSDHVTPVKVHQDVNMFVSELSPGASLSTPLEPTRQAYLLCVEGKVSVTVNGETKVLERHDAIEVPHVSETSLIEVAAVDVEPTEGGDVAHILMFEMKEDPSSGRRDL